MNNSSLPIYYSKESLTIRFADYSNVYLMPTVCAFGIATSLICILVSLKRDESNAKLFNYIILNSSIDFIFLWCEFFIFIIRCGILCEYGNTYGAKIYEIYIFLYAGYVLVNSQVFLSIYIAYDRLRLFSTKDSSKNQISIFKVYIICFLISVLSNLAQLISRQVIPVGILIPDPNSTYFEVLYVKAFRPEFQSQIADILLTVNLFVKDIIMFIVLCVLNIWICVRFRAYLKSRKFLIKKTTKFNNQQPIIDQEKRNTEKRENNFTLLTLIYCLIYAIGNFIDSFSLMANVFSIDIYVTYWYVNIVGNFLFFLSHGVHLFMYYFLNSAFRGLFNDLFRVERFFNSRVLPQIKSET